MDNVFNTACRGGVGVHPSRQSQASVLVASTCHQRIECGKRILSLPWSCRLLFNYYYC